MFSSLHMARRSRRASRLWKSPHACARPAQGGPALRSGQGLRGAGGGLAAPQGGAPACVRVVVDHRRFSYPHFWESRSPLFQGFIQPLLWDQGVYPTTSVILLGISLLFGALVLGKPVFVVSQKWSFPHSPGALLVCDPQNG